VTHQQPTNREGRHLLGQRALEVHASDADAAQQRVLHRVAKFCMLVLAVLAEVLHFRPHRRLADHWFKEEDAGSGRHSFQESKHRVSFERLQPAGDIDVLLLAQRRVGTDALKQLFLERVDRQVCIGLGLDGELVQQAGPCLRDNSTQMAT
jgi:hypothetical protein